MAASALETASLFLRPHEPEHLRALIESSDSYEQRSGLKPANGLRDFIVSDDVSPEWLATLENAAGADPWRFGFAVVHRETELVIGTAGLTGPPDVDKAVEIAYGIVPEYQGRGYATEAAAAVIAWVVQNGSVTTLRAHTLPERNASSRVLEKCGFRQVGEMDHPTDGLIWRWERQLATAVD
jgi:RimJ/RimL family protein N-acetyltransferase